VNSPGGGLSLPGLSFPLKRFSRGCGTSRLVNSFENARERSRYGSPSATSFRSFAEPSEQWRATGLRDSRQRRHPTLAWDVWRAEAPWMTVYFSIGVWISLAMVLLERAASRS